MIECNQHIEKFIVTMFLMFEKLEKLSNFSSNMESIKKKVPEKTSKMKNKIS